MCQRKWFLANNKKFKPHIADAYMTFQKTCEVKQGAHPWRKHPFQAKEFIRKIKAKGIYTSILDRIQNDDKFHASQPEHHN